LLVCPVARALDLIGDRWTILILRDLILEGPRKFQDLQRAFPKMSPNTLSRGKSTPGRPRRKGRDRDRRIGV